MISLLRGKVISSDEGSIIVDVAGFGVEVLATKSLIMHAVIGEELTCFAYMQISDAGVNMFGFSTQREKDIFLELVQVKTVGGKLAIAILRYLSTEDILHAIAAGTPAMLTAPGLGAKRAERICFELKNKIAKKFPDIGEDSMSFAATSFDSSVMDALIGLGFTQSESARAISMSKGSAPDNEWSEETLLKTSLGILQRR
jgi:Holliday junction DNA helicase RuvA